MRNTFWDASTIHELERKWEKNKKRHLIEAAIGLSVLTGILIGFTIAVLMIFG